MSASAQQIQLWTYNNTQYRGGSANSYYYEWSGGDALRAAAYWLQQTVTPELGLLHVTPQGRCQWLAADKRLCDQGVQHGDTVILLSTRTWAPTPQVESEQKVAVGNSLILHHDSQPASADTTDAGASIDAGGKGAPAKTAGQELDFHGNPIGGIIAHLTKKCRGDVHKEGLVNVTASSASDEAFVATYLDDMSEFFSADEPNSWLRFQGKTCDSHWLYHSDL